MVMSQTSGLMDQTSGDVSDISCDAWRIRSDRLRITGFQAPAGGFQAPALAHPGDHGSLGNGSDSTELVECIQAMRAGHPGIQANACRSSYAGELGQGRAGQGRAGQGRA